MKIDLTNIPPEGKGINLELGSEWLGPNCDDDRIIGFESPLSARIKLYPIGKKIAVEGFLSVKLVLSCDRCLEPYTWGLSTDFRIYVSIEPYKGGLEVELLEDDLSLDFIDGNILDTDLIIKEQLILHVPMKTICKENCKGLCPICGCNLNTATCSCSLKNKNFLFKN